MLKENNKDLIETPRGHTVPLELACAIDVMEDMVADQGAVVSDAALSLKMAKMVDAGSRHEQYAQAAYDQGKHYLDRLEAELATLLAQEENFMPGMVVP